VNSYDGSDIHGNSNVYFVTCAGQ